MYKFTKEKENKMKQKVFVKLVKMMSLVLSALLLVNAPLLEASAAEYGAESGEEIVELDATIIDKVSDTSAINPNVRTFLVNCFLNIYSSSDGMLVEMSTDTTKVASVIGVKDIKIQKKVWYGWKTVATSSGAESKNTNTIALSVLYEDAEYGETYRVSCVHYGDVDGYTEVKNQIDSFEFIY